MCACVCAAILVGTFDFRTGNDTLSSCGHFAGELLHLVWIGIRKSQITVQFRITVGGDSECHQGGGGGTGTRRCTTTGCH